MNRIAYTSIFSLLVSLTSFSQTKHEFKLPYGTVIEEEMVVENGGNVYRQYERKQIQVNGIDTFIHIERFRINKMWMLNTYILDNGKPLLSGWQQRFSNNGVLMEEQYCEQSKKCPETKTYVYYPSGQLMSVTNFKKDKRHGPHFLYYPNGQMRQVIWFEAGRMMEVAAYYNEQGVPLDQGSLCDGDGYANVFSLNGELIKVKVYKKGKMVKESLVKGDSTKY